MTDKIQKALNKLTDKERKAIKIVLADLAAGRMSGYDVKKLKGRSDVYRIRKGKLRLIYRTEPNGDIFLLAVERRTDTTYDFL